MARAVAVGLLVLVSARAAGAYPFALAYARTSPEVAAGDEFGTAVALDGGMLVVGAPRHDTGGVADAGAAYVYDAATGTLGATLHAATPSLGARAGSAAAASGGRVYLGAPHDGTSAPHAGAVDVFDASGGALGDFPDPHPDLDDGFGCALVPLLADLVVGARLDSEGAPAGGSYDSQGAAWIVDAGSGAAGATLASTNPHTADFFGAAVAASSDVIAVGAPGDDTAGTNAGAVYLFDATTHAFLRRLVPPAPAANDAFGEAVAVDGTRVLVGAPLAEANGTSNGGVAYLFDATSGAQLLQLVAPTPESDARFGSAVAFRGADFAVGAPYEDRGALQAGAVYLFAADGTAAQTIADPDPEEGDQFGGALATDGDAIVVVGAAHAAVAAADAGAVYVFADQGTSTTTETTSTTTTSTTGAGTTSTGATSSTTESTTTSTESTTTDTDTTTTETTTTESTTTETETTTTETGGLPPTTAAPVACAGPGDPACDDGDGCTVDSCGTDGVCRHDPTTDHDAVVCRLTAMETAIAAGLRRPAASARLQAKLHHATLLVEQARAGKQAARRLGQAERQVASVVPLVRRLAHRGAIAGDLGARLASLASEAIDVLKRLRAATRHP